MFLSPWQPKRGSKKYSKHTLLLWSPLSPKDNEDLARWEFKWKINLLCLSKCKGCSSLSFSSLSCSSFHPALLLSFSFNTGFRKFYFYFDASPELFQDCLYHCKSKRKWTVVNFQILYTLELKYFMKLLFFIIFLLSGITLYSQPYGGALLDEDKMWANS